VNLDPPFKDPQIPDGERTVYRGTIDGDDVGTGELRIDATDERYVAQLDSRILTHTNLSVEMAFSRTRGVVRAESYRAETRDDDRPLSVEEGWFRDVRGLHWGGELQPYPSNITPLLGCALALRGLDFTKGERHNFALWLANSVWWEIALHVHRRERIDIPAGTFDAWRVTAHIQFEPIGAALNRVVQAILPPFRIHFDAEPPHRFLRFSFPTGPFPWNPRGLIEAAEV
jgi:hypothetical protein